tara:strand:+ start:2594 stop:2815 length:222 start_codon:yes stop_codon:yes gene_type:complete
MKWVRRIFLSTLLAGVVLALWTGKSKVVNVGTTICPMLWELRDRAGKEFIVLRGEEVCKKTLMGKLRAETRSY